MSRLFHLNAPQPVLLEVTGNGLAPIEILPVDRERQIEDWLASDLAPLGLDALPIGRQVPTPFGGIIDLLAVDASGDLVVIEIKRDRSPRSCIAQLLEYASWVAELDGAATCDLYRRHQGSDLAVDFLRRFGAPLPDIVNERHRLVLLAGAIDATTHRIARYLADRARVDLSLITFTVYRFGEREIVAIDRPVTLSRDTEKTQPGPAADGIWFVNVGIDPNADWEDNRRFGYVGARGAAHGQRLAGLKSGDWLFAYRAGAGDRRGYVGFGTATGTALPADEAEIAGRPFLSLPVDRRYFAASPASGGEPAFILPVQWFKTVPDTEARRFRGAFANQNVVCRLTDVATLDFLRRSFCS